MKNSIICFWFFVLASIAFSDVTDIPAFVKAQKLFEHEKNTIIKEYTNDVKKRYDDAKKRQDSEESDRLQQEIEELESAFFSSEDHFDGSGNLYKRDVTKKIIKSQLKFEATIENLAVELAKAGKNEDARSIRNFLKQEPSEENLEKDTEKNIPQLTEKLVSKTAPHWRKGVFNFKNYLPHIPVLTSEKKSSHYEWNLLVNMEILCFKNIR
jgi:hypothetical protein